MSRALLSDRRILSLSKFACFVAIVLLSTSMSVAQGKKDGGSAGTPWPPPGIPPSVDLNTNGIESLLNGGLIDQPLAPNFTPFTNIEFNPFAPVQDPQCSIGIDLQGQIPGLQLRDPRCIRLIPPIPIDPPPFLYFGPTDECGLGVLPDIPGLSGRDPVGLRLLGDWDGVQATQGLRLLFGPTDDCRLEVDPLVLDGLRIYDPRAIRICNPDPILPPPFILFGPDDSCGLGVDPNVPGMTVRDDNGLVISNIGSSGKDGVRLNQVDPNSGRSGLRVSNLGSSGKDGVSIDLGPTGECRLEAIPPGLPELPGLRLYDPSTIRICPPVPTLPIPPIVFGPTDDCGLGVLPGLPGLSEFDPTGFRLLGQNQQGCRLIFGPTLDCTIEIDPLQRPDDGMIFRDVRGFAFDGPRMRLTDPGQAGRLSFGPSDDCSIGLQPGRLGMIILEVNGTFFESPLAPGDALVDVDGVVQALSFVQRSTRDQKENIQTLTNALDTVQKLRGVSFDWKQEFQSEGETRDIGFIAEEVAEVIPEVVEFDKDGKKAKGVKYANLVSLVVESVKEQQQQIESQQKLIEDLQAENAQLKAQQSERTAQLEDEVHELQNKLDAVLEALNTQK